MKTIRIETLGCSKNTVDTEHLLSLVEAQFEIVPESDQRSVDYCLLNTCGFIGDAKQESIDAILAAAEKKKRGEIGQLWVFGCLSQRYMDSLPELIPEVDKWFGARTIAPIAKALGCADARDNVTERYMTQTGKGYAYLKISEGCDRRCSYCAIPFIRGAHKSVPIEDLVKEASFLASQGVKELVLIAQDTTFYGLDLYRRRALADLLKALSEVEGIEWLRIHYSYPADFPQDVLDQMADNPKVCKYLDIPLQHISDGVLDKMHRHVDGKWTRELIAKLRERVPGVVLRTTMIVGHPGESEKDFQELLDFVREAKFERLGAFTYSEEEGTYGAEHFEDDIPEDVKQERLERLMTTQRDVSSNINFSRIGSVEKVMVDDYINGSLVCRSQYESPEVDGEIFVAYPAEGIDGKFPEDFIGDFANVRITKADEYDLIAELI